MLLSIFYGTISILAVIGNSLVIWIVATTRQMQTVTNMFIANLALADVVIGMFAIPFQVSCAIKREAADNFCKYLRGQKMFVGLKFQKLYSTLQKF